MSIPTINQSPAITNLSFLPGDTFSFDVTINDANDQPVNISTYTFKAFILVETTEYDFTITIVDALQGKLKCTMGKDITINIINCSVWKLIVIPTTGVQYTYLYGNVITQKI